VAPERELFVICPQCSSEVSPYVTECPYCGSRLRKRAPDLKKQRQREERQQRRRARAGRAHGRPIATLVLIAIAAVASILATSGPARITAWMLEHLVFTGELAGEPWKLVTAPLLQYSFGYGFVCLFAFALFGGGVERRFGTLAVVAVWLICGALGVLAEALIAPVPLTFGAYAVAAGAVLAWTIAVAGREGLQGHDPIGLAAVAFVLCMLPLATAAARPASLVGGVVGGLACGLVLARLPERS
jgi:membrane associated rhomboid family serine protease